MNNFALQLGDDDAEGVVVVDVVGEVADVHHKVGDVDHYSKENVAIREETEGAVDRLVER